MDVKSVYTSTLNHEGIAAVKERYDKCTNKTIPTKIITMFLGLILTLNNFMFNSKFYLQIKGCAMATICAPNNANIFRAVFEEKYTYPLIKKMSLLYVRFIDNIFITCAKSENELKKFMKDLHIKHSSIKFDFEYS